MANTPNYVELTSDVVSAYVSNNSVSRVDLPALIGSVHAALSGASAPAAAKEELTPPVPINKTIRPDLHHQPRGRPPVQVHEAAPLVTRHDAGAVSDEMGLAPGLSYGGVGLFGRALCARKGARPRSEVVRAQA